MTQVLRIQDYQIGTDVEYFVRNDQNEIISAEGLIRGTKQYPYKFDETNEFFATSLDNVLAEGNTPPVTSKLEWLQSINKLRAYIDSTLPKGYCTVADPAHRMNERWLQTKNARNFGCEPAHIVWGGIKDNPDRKTNLRTAGLHIHVSSKEYDIDAFEDLIKAMDLYLSVPAVIIEPPNERKENYGKAGEFRFGKSYIGVEYRSLSSYFAGSDQRLGWVYDNTELAIDAVNDGLVFTDETSQMIQEAINSNNRNVAINLIQQFNIPVLNE